MEMNSEPREYIYYMNCFLQKQHILKYIKNIKQSLKQTDKQDCVTQKVIFI